MTSGDRMTVDDQVAARMLRAAGAARVVNASQPGPGGPDVVPGQAGPAAGTEAGQ